MRWKSALTLCASSLSAIRMTMVLGWTAAILRTQIVFLALLLSVSTMAHGQEINLVTNGSFENPVVSGYQYQPPSTDWYYSRVGGDGAGISDNSNLTGFETSGAVPDGRQFCFVQGPGNYVSEPVTFPASGTYALAYYAGGRYAGNGSAPTGDTSYGLYLDSTLLADGTTTTSTAMTQVGPVYFTAPAGTETLEILITSTPPGDSTDQTALFDNVSITPVSTPEPSTLALLAVAAIGLLGYGCRRRSTRRIAGCAMLLISVVGTAQADVFNMPNGQTSLQFVTVGDPGNVADPATGNIYGSVPYVYQMGTYDVTVGQYCQFLNAVAKTDLYGLYSPGMATDFPTIAIARNGSSGNYNYSVTGGYGQAANCPIFDVTWGDAARFTNWLDNGQPTAPEGPATTESGAYNLSGATTASDLMAVLAPPHSGSNAPAYFLPTENEWYKAAYYAGGGTNAGYWTYPTQSNTAPINTLPDTGNHASFYDANGTGNHTYTDPQNYLTPVNAFAESLGAYGTYGMGGDVYQWNELNFETLNEWRGVRGGGWTNGTNAMEPSFSLYYVPSMEYDYVGFRVAGSEAVPEPSSIALLGAGAAALLAYTWRRRAARRTAKPTAFDESEQQNDGPAILSMPSRWTEAARRVA